MKKILPILFFIAAGLSAYFYLEPEPEEAGSKTKTVIDSTTPLTCSQCDVKSSVPPPCLNCMLHNKIRMQSGEELDGKIIKITKDKVIIQVAYGSMTVNKSEIIFDLPEELEPVTVTPPKKQEQPSHETSVKTEEKIPELQPETPVVNLPLPPASTVTPKTINKCLSGHTWIAYTPSVYSPGSENTISDEDISSDMELLISCGFNGLVTYSSEKKMATIPLIAKQNGFKAVIMGIWDPKNQEEMNNAIQAKDYADAYCLGNEGLHFARYSYDKLIEKLRELKNASGRAVTTSEPLDIVLNTEFPQVMKECDFLFLIAHFFFDPDLKSKNPQQGVQWLLSVTRDVKARVSSNKPLMLKEVGYPSGGEDWASEKNQDRFLDSMENRNVLYCCFEAFDQPWKTGEPIEPYWGIFKRDRTPKEYAKQRIELSSKKRRYSHR
ncbi:MAG: hypothetical protein JW774_00705 [Candidatus Aureabacteria bacterium]|nr:hypothetical protein [Candidatus Auribacterota bacterium]